MNNKKKKKGKKMFDGMEDLVIIINVYYLFIKTKETMFEDILFDNNKPKKKK